MSHRRAHTTPEAALQNSPSCCADTALWPGPGRDELGPRLEHGVELRAHHMVTGRCTPAPSAGLLDECSWSLRSPSTPSAIVERANAPPARSSAATHTASISCSSEAPRRTLFFTAPLVLTRGTSEDAMVDPGTGHNLRGGCRVRTRGSPPSATGRWSGT